MAITDFQELAAWQRVNELRREIIAVTAKEPVKRDFKFCSQIQDAISSACRNTSEGFGRFRPTENARLVEIARASICEVQDLLLEARQKSYVDNDLFDRLWTLSRRALGTNTNYGKYLRRCADNWRRRRKKPRSPEP
jgi:four helix bundle protein